MGADTCTSAGIGEIDAVCTGAVRKVTVRTRSGRIGSFEPAAGRISLVPATALAAATRAARDAGCTVAVGVGSACATIGAEAMGAEVMGAEAIGVLAKATG
jgi:hypothetical protein